MDEGKETGGDNNASFESSNLNPEASSSVKELSPGPNSSEPGKYELWASSKTQVL